MTSGTADAAFSGSIPELYHRHLGPLLFRPYALDLAARIAASSARDLLETAAGTGIVTQMIIETVPDAKIIATDLNQAMLDVAEREIASPRLSFRQADAQALPFEDARFDAVICQFGAMFFPDRISAYREARRVLKPSGLFLFNVWDRIEANPSSAALADAVAALFPDDPPSFLRRVPFGYHDLARIEQDLRAAGFTHVSSETLVKQGRLQMAEEEAVGLCHGSPLRAEIEAHGPGSLDRATEAATIALARLGQASGGQVPMSAHVISAR
jgi:ubiquinone/menaquinone biosynthesis C-methylase UbiE